MESTKITADQAQRILQILYDIYGRKHGVKLTVTVTGEKKHESTV